MNSIFQILGQQLRKARKDRGMTQTELSHRVGRSFTRVSELERDLKSDRWGRDRLTLFAEICDALDVVPVLVPRARAQQIERSLEPATVGPRRNVSSAFDEVFVDLEDDDEEIG